MQLPCRVHSDSEQTSLSDAFVLVNSSRFLSFLQLTFRQKTAVLKSDFKPFFRAFVYVLQNCFGFSRFVLTPFSKAEVGHWAGLRLHAGDTRCIRYLSFQAFPGLVIHSGRSVFVF